MKKIILLSLTLSSLMFGEIYAGKYEVVGDRSFQYYCVDGLLFLESKSKSSNNNGMFGQVYIQSTNSNVRSIPIVCEVKNNQIVTK